MAAGDHELSRRICYACNAEGFTCHGPWYDRRFTKCRFCGGTGQHYLNAKPTTQAVDHAGRATNKPTYGNFGAPVKK